MVYRNPLGTMVTDPKRKWSFGYDFNIRHLGLKIIDKPFGGRDEYIYDKPSYATAAWGEDTKQNGTISKLKHQNGADIDISTHYATLVAKWANQTFCTENFCFITVLNRDPNDSLNFSVVRNNGTSFEPAKDETGADIVRGYKPQAPPAPFSSFLGTTISSSWTRTPRKSGFMSGTANTSKCIPTLSGAGLQLARWRP